MKSLASAIVAIVLAVGRLLSGTPVQAAELTPEEARSIAMDAYVYFYPLVSMDITRRQSTNIEAGKEIAKGPMNMFVSVPEYPPADLKIVVRVNFDKADPPQEVIDACRAHGKSPGILVYDPAVARRLLALGFRFVGIGADGCQEVDRVALGFIDVIVIAPARLNHQIAGLHHAQHHDDGFGALGALRGLEYRAVAFLAVVDDDEIGA